VTGIVIAVVAAIITVTAALVLALSMSDRVRRRPDRPAEQNYAGPPGYGRSAGYGPPPLWTDTSRDPP